MNGSILFGIITGVYLDVIRMCLSLLLGRNLIPSRLVLFKVLFDGLKQCHDLFSRRSVFGLGVAASLENLRNRSGCRVGQCRTKTLSCLHQNLEVELQVLVLAEGLFVVTPESLC